MKPSEPHQLELFASSTMPETSTSPGSQASIAASTYSSDSSPKAKATAATSTASTTRAVAPSRRVTAGTAVISRVDAKRMAARAQLRMPPTSIGESTPNPDLEIPRPQNRSECRLEASDRRPGNPCPWVGCRHHLLLEVASHRPIGNRDARPTTIRLNTRARKRTGRKPGLPASAGERRTRVWVDDALELLFSMPYTCSLDVRQWYPDGASAAGIGRILGITEQAVQEELQKPHVQEAAAIIEKLRSDDDDLDTFDFDRALRVLQRIRDRGW